MTSPAAFSGIVLKPYREYPTFQALYELHPKSGATREGVFKKTVLIVMDWIRNKTKNGIGRDESMLRIYFYYDRDIGKSIIGSMPGHLENGMR